LEFEGALTFIGFFYIFYCILCSDFIVVLVKLRLAISGQCPKYIGIPSKLCFIIQIACMVQRWITLYLFPDVAALCCRAVTFCYYFGCFQYKFDSRTRH